MSTRTTSKSTDRSGRVGGVQGRLRDTMTEIRKVSWPDSQTTRNLTMLVIVMGAILGALLGGIDAIFIRLWDWIPN